MNVLDLFSGIGGFSLGLERAGMRTVAFCEIDPFCRAVLRKHWPSVPIFEDVRTLRGKPGCSLFSGTENQVRTWVDVICGGFPCQDISEAGKGVGITGERSGLWREYARLVGELRPRYVIVENVSALLGRGLGDVLGDLAALGYDAEWHCIPASAVGAPHERDRVWIVAYPNGEGHERKGCAVPGGWGKFAGDALSNVRRWEAAPRVSRRDDGVLNWAHRVKSIGNAVVPQIPEIIGKAIMNAEAKFRGTLQETPTEAEVE